MFVEGMNLKVQAEFMRLPNAIDMEDMILQEVLVFAKRVEQAVRLQARVSAPEESTQADKLKSKRQHLSKPRLGLGFDADIKYKAKAGLA